MKISHLNCLAGFSMGHDGLKCAARQGIRLAVVALVCAPFGLGQQAEARPVLVATNETPSLAMPDAPGAVMAADTARVEGASSSKDAAGAGVFDDQAAKTGMVSPMASTTDKYIAPGQPVPKLTAGNKVVLGIKDSFSPFSAVGWLITAGYEQGTNGSPNFTQDGKGFAQRLGASAARASSETIFSDSVLSVVLHEDPRYYRLGSGHNFFHRALYAATRPLITRTDGGHVTPNFAIIGGNLGGAYLTKAYYPSLNTSNTEVLKTFGGSMGGSAIGFAVSEFLSGALNILHSSKAAGN